MLLPQASLTGPIVEFCVNVINDTGLAGIFLLMGAGSACIPIPSEAVMLFAGFTVSEGHHTLLEILIAGFLGNMAGSWLTYAIGYYGRVDLMERNKLIHVSPARLARVDGWFKRHGDLTVLVCRVIPLVRAFISLPAGLAKMPFWRFTWLTALGSIPWVIGFGLLGRAVGDEWEKWREHLSILDYIVVAVIVVAIAYWIYKRVTRDPAAQATTSGRLSDGRLPVHRAIALGIVQGPAELLPVSSSAHIVLLPWLAGWDWDAIDPEVRKSFEVALHTGAAAALLIGQRRVIVEELRQFDLNRALLLAFSFAPAAFVGYRWERQIEARLGGPRATAFGLLAGAALMVIADRRPQLRGRGEATPLDGLALGVAQSAALAPGVSRNGVTLAAARWRRFSREQANILSRTIALPIIVGATGLKGTRLAKRGTTPELRRTLAVGIGASFVSTLASQRLIGLVERDRALWPYAAYRAALAGVVLAKLRRASS